MERSMWYLTFLAGGACEAGTKEDLNRRRCKLNSFNFWRPSECFIISEPFFIHLSHASCMRVTCKSHVICVWVVCELTFWTKFSSKRHPLLSSCDIWLKRVCSWKFCIGKWISNIVSKLLHPRNPPGRRKGLCFVLDELEYGVRKDAIHVTVRVIIVQFGYTFCTTFLIRQDPLYQRRIDSFEDGTWRVEVQVGLPTVNDTFCIE